MRAFRLLCLAFGWSALGWSAAPAAEPRWHTTFPASEPAGGPPRLEVLTTRAGRIELEVPAGFSVAEAVAAPFEEVPRLPLLEAVRDDRGAWYVLELLPPTAVEAAVPDLWGLRTAPRLARLRVARDLDGDGRFERVRTLLPRLPAGAHLAAGPNGLFVGLPDRVVRLREPWAGDPRTAPAESSWETLLVRTEQAPQAGAPRPALGPEGDVYLALEGTANCWRGTDGSTFRLYDSAAVVRCRDDGRHLQEWAIGACRPAGPVLFDRLGQGFYAEIRPAAAPPGRRLFLHALFVGKEFGWRWRGSVESPVAGISDDLRDWTDGPLASLPQEIGPPGFPTTACLYDGCGLPLPWRQGFLTNDLLARDVSLLTRANRVPTAGPLLPEFYLDDGEETGPLEPESLMQEEPERRLRSLGVVESNLRLLRCRAPWSPVRIFVGPDDRLHVGLGRTDRPVPGFGPAEFPAEAVVVLSWNGRPDLGPAVPPRIPATPPIGPETKRAALWEWTDSPHGPTRRNAIEELARRPDPGFPDFDWWLDSPLTSPERLLAAADVLVRRGEGEAFTRLLRLAESSSIRSWRVRKRALSHLVRGARELPDAEIVPLLAKSADRIRSAVDLGSLAAAEEAGLLAVLAERFRKHEAIAAEIHFDELLESCIDNRIWWADVGQDSVPTDDHEAAGPTLRAAEPAQDRLLDRYRTELAAAQFEDWSSFIEFARLSGTARVGTGIDDIMANIEWTEDNENHLLILLRIRLRILRDRGGSDAALRAWLAKNPKSLKVKHLSPGDVLSLVPPGDEAALKTAWKTVDGLGRRPEIAPPGPEIAAFRQVESADRLARDLTRGSFAFWSAEPGSDPAPLAALRPLLREPARLEVVKAGLRKHFERVTDRETLGVLTLLGSLDGGRTDADELAASALAGWASGVAKSTSPVRLRAVIEYVGETRDGTIDLARRLRDGKLPLSAVPFVLQRLALHDEHRPDPEARALAAELTRLQDAGGAIEWSAAARRTCRWCHAPELRPLDGWTGSWKAAARRLPDDALRASLENPSRDLPAEHTAWRLLTRDGRLHHGLLAYDSDREVVLVKGDGSRLHLRPEEVAECLPSRVSPMPPRLLGVPTAAVLEALRDD